MNIKEKEKLYNKMTKKYGDVMSKYYLIEKCLNAKNETETELEILQDYQENLMYGWC